MSNNHTGNVQPAVDLEEHRSKNINVKAVLAHGYNPGSDQYVPVSVVDNGDGTYSMKTIPSGSPTQAQKITVSGANTYVASAPIGTLQSAAAWQVKRVNVTGGDTVITSADGNANYDNVATDLTVLSYS